ncbi:hypothetical protein Tco_0972104 [Tanacetum coccineum]
MNNLPANHQHPDSRGHEQSLLGYNFQLSPPSPSCVLQILPHIRMNGTDTNRLDVSYPKGEYIPLLSSSLSLSKLRKSSTVYPTKEVITSHRHNVTTETEVEERQIQKMVSQLLPRGSTISLSGGFCPHPQHGPSSTVSISRPPAVSGQQRNQTIGVNQQDEKLLPPAGIRIYQPVLCWLAAGSSEGCEETFADIIDILSVLCFDIAVTLS